MRSIDRLIDWLIDWLFVWLIDWLIDWLICMLNGAIRCRWRASSSTSVPAMSIYGISGKELMGWSFPLATPPPTRTWPSKKFPPSSTRPTASARCGKSKFWIGWSMRISLIFGMFCGRRVLIWCGTCISCSVWWRRICISCWRRRSCRRSISATLCIRFCGDWSISTRRMCSIAIWSRVICCWIPIVIWRLVKFFSKKIWLLSGTSSLIDWLNKCILGSFLSACVYGWLLDLPSREWEFNLMTFCSSSAPCFHPFEFIKFILYDFTVKFALVSFMC